MIKGQENIDYLAEVIVTHMLANKKIDDKWLTVHLIGVFKRFFSKEVERIQHYQSREGETVWDIFVHREGMYDALPEGFFHTSTGKFFKDKRETLEEFKRHRQEEKDARLFFLPFEQEFFKYRINKEQFEQDFFYSPEGVEEFVDFFNLADLDLNPYQKSSLFFIVPHIPSIVGNLNLTQTCFEIILQEQVQIQLASHWTEKENFPDLFRLSELYLGANSVLGNTYTDFSPGIRIIVGPLSDSGQLISYLHGKRKKVLDRLINLFIQADMKVRTEIILKDEDQKFTLGEKKYESRLKYSTTL